MKKPWMSSGMLTFSSLNSKSTSKSIVGLPLQMNLDSTDLVEQTVGFDLKASQQQQGEPIDQWTKADSECFPVSIFIYKRGHQSNRHLSGERITIQPSLLSAIVILFMAFSSIIRNLDSTAALHLLPFYGHKNPEHFLKYSLNALRTSYIDLYLMHTPLPSKLNAAGDDFEAVEGKPVPELIPLIDTWRFFEQEYKAGTLKWVGISNFNQHQIQELYDQVELHILHPQNELVNFCKKLDISLTSYSTLGSPGSAQMRQVRAQILIRQMVQRGISTIPKSTNPSRVLENINIFDFEISPQDMPRFETDVKEHKQLFKFELLQHHPWFPWKINRQK
uniref:NADP-dependent oxidoreductase domain-containing protein n=1 Tax=Ditylenchus dipsaci TaxID=166011 RepID=A0A915D1V2_9BILA